LRSIYFSHIETPIGQMIACSSEKGIILLQFEEPAQPYIEKFSPDRTVELIQSKNTFLSKLEDQLKEYFSGNRMNFSIDLDLQGSELRQKIWHIVRNIPFGETRFYEEIARETGRKNYTRVIANANAHNDILLVIPCHRVIGSGNKLTGYRGGIERKRWLINFERSLVSKECRNTLF